MRVAIDVTPLLLVRTGIAAFTEGALNGLAAQGEVSLTAYAVSWRGRRGLRQAVPDTTRIARRPMAARPLHAIWRHLDGPSIEWWTGPVDVVHGTNFVVPPARRAAQVVTVHDMTCVRFPELCEPASLRYPDLIRRAVDRGAMVHTPSWTMAEEVVALLNIPPSRVRAIYHGVDRPCGDGSITHPVAGGRPYILGLGTIEPRKDFPLLVRAFDLVAGEQPDLHLVIAGPSGWGEQALLDALSRARHRDRVVRLGWVDPAQRAALLRGAWAFAYPSVYEGFGLPPLEAMTVGTPVLATAAGAVPEVVGDAALQSPVGDVNGLAASMTRLFDDSAERTRLVEAGRQQAAKFTWDRCANGLRDLYAEAVHDKTRTSPDHDHLAA